MIRVDFDNRTTIDEDSMAGIVSVWKVWLVGMCHIRANHEAIGQHTFIVIGFQMYRRSDTFQSIWQETTGRAFDTLTADFLVVEKRANQGVATVK